MATPEIRNIATRGGNLCQDIRCWYYRYLHYMGGIIMCFRKRENPCKVIKGDNCYHAIIDAKKCFGVCPSDTAIALAALDAELENASSKCVRQVSINEFSTNLRNILKADELLIGIRISNPAAGGRQAFFKFIFSTKQQY